MKRCPNCRCIGLSAKYCINCGSEMREIVLYRCPCGEELDVALVRFCGHCGRPVVEGLSEPSIQEVDGALEDLARRTKAEREGE